MGPTLAAVQAVLQEGAWFRSVAGPPGPQAAANTSQRKVGGLGSTDADREGGEPPPERRAPKKSPKSPAASQKETDSPSTNGDSAREFANVISISRSSNRAYKKKQLEVLRGYSQTKREPPPKLGNGLDVYG